MKGLILIGVSVLLVFVSSIINSNILFGLGIICFGIAIIVLTIEGWSKSRTATNVIGGYAIVLGLVIMFMDEITILVESIVGHSSNAGAFIFINMISGIFLSLGVYKGIVVPFRCKKTAEGKVIRHVFMSQNKSIRYYCIDFQYKYENRIYQTTTSEVYRESRLKNFEIGKSYKIYVNPKDLQEIRATKGIDGSSALMLVVGVLFFVTGNLGLLGFFI